MDIKTKVSYLKEELYELIKTDEGIFDFIQENAADGLWFRDLEDPENEWMNDRFWEVLGYDPDTKPQKTSAWQCIINRDDLKVEKDNLSKHCDNPDHPYNQVVRYTHKNGSTVRMRRHGFAIRDKDGKPVRMLGAHLNTAETKNSEIELLKAKERAKESEQLLSRTQQVAHIGSWKLDLITNKITWSDETYRIFGVDPQDFPATYEGFLCFVHPDDRSAVDEAYTGSLQEGRDTYDIEHRIIRQDTGEVRYVYDRCAHYRNDSGDVIQSIGTVQDITDRKKIELELLQNTNALKRSQRLSKTGSWEFIVADQSTIWSEETHRIFGLEPGSAPTTYDDLLDQCIHPDDAEYLHYSFMKAIENQDILEIEHRIVRPDGSIRLLYHKAHPYYDDHGNLSRYVGVAQDITERKETEKKLNLIQRAIVASSISVFITDAEGKITYVNPYFTKVTGYTFEEVRGKNPRIFNSGNESKAFYKNLWDTIKSGKEWTGEVQNMKKNGDLISVKQIISPIIDNNTGEVTHYVSIKEDITELLEKEEELKQSLKEKEVLLAEIHHRVKNNLAVVAGMIQLQVFDEENPEIQEKLSDSITRINAIGNIHEKLYQHESFSSIDISENVRDLTHEIVAQLNSGKKITVDLSLSQVQLNINQAVPCSLIINEVIVNALKHAFIEAEDGTITVHTSEHGNQVQIKITDDGIGLPDDFTIKSQSSGTKIIQVLTEQLNGTYRYKSLKTGTEFSLTFEKDNVKGSSSTLI
ncbi:PAS domain-containing protein [Gracilimonas sp. Q87]|uniref:PAS domain-containing sensor histidine kinase n=1 Tax=Gracilimonas sp. Q87 TaxID=3384766 RepID=UPI00398425FE